MKKFIIILLVLPYFACSSTPSASTASKPAEKQPTASPAAASPAATAAPVVSGDAARAQEARQKVVDFEGPSYFPGEWDAAEKLYADGAYDAAADAYESLFKLTIPLYAQAREDEIMGLRDALIAAGAKEIAMEYFSPADDAALKALEQYEAGDYYAAKDSADKALTMYQTLTNACNAWLLGKEITERGFEGYDPDNFTKAGEILGSAMDAYEAGDNPLALERSEEALLRYNLVLSNAWAAYAELRASYAEAERQAALEVKANIATKDLFNEADTNYKTGINSFNSKSYQEAAVKFIDSEAMFIAASASATEKRRHAVEVIKQAQEKIEESDETAKQAELILEGGAE